MEAKEYKLMYQLEDEHWWFTAKRLFIKTYLNFLPNKDKLRILDIGCGTGRNLELLKKFGFASGIDSSVLAVKFCQKRGLKNVTQNSAERIPFTANFFDLITLFDVLYHKNIISDLEVLKEINRVIKPKGHILITDCAHQFLFGPHDISMHARQRYSKKELINKISQAGFSIQKASYIYFITFPLFLINRFIAKYLTRKSGSDVNQVSPAINQLLIYLLSFESKLLKFFNLPLGSSIIILAQK